VNLIEPISIHETFISDDPAAVAKLRQTIWDGVHSFVTPGMSDFLKGCLDDQPKRFAWLFAAHQGERRWVLEYDEADEPHPGANKEGFVAWLDHFSPVNCNDWLMVPFMYMRHVYDEKPIDSHSLRFPPNTVLDELLRPTRGLLLWRHQFSRLFYLALDIGTEEARQLQKRFFRDEPEATGLLEKTLFSGRSLASILDERTLGKTYLAGMPDYYLSGFLSEHMTTRNACNLN